MESDITQLIEIAKQSDIDAQLSVLPQRPTAFCDFFAKKIEENKRNNNEQKVLFYTILQIVTSVYLNPSDINMPYKPFFVSSQRRSYALEDLTEDGISFLKDFLLLTENNILKGRIADILWLRGQGFEYAKTAISCFRQYPKTEETWYDGAADVWERTIRMLLRFGRGLQAEFEAVQRDFFSLFLSLPYVKTGYIFDLSRFLILLKVAQESAQKVIDKLSEFKNNAYHEKDWFVLQDFYNELLAWYSYTNNDDEIFKLHAEKAEYFVEQAKTRESLAAAEFYSSAIKEYRMIPSTYRTQFDVEKKITEIHNAMDTSRINAMHGMVPISGSFPMDNLGDYLNSCANKISHNDFYTALFNLSNICPLPKEDKYKEDAIKMLQEHPLMAILGTGYISSLGGLEAKTPGIELSGIDSVQNEIPVFHQMLKTYELYMTVSAQTAILHSLDTFNMEHKISLQQIIDICSYSTVVPHNRIYLWARGLYHGFNYDFADSIHLLTPQIENMVRVLMRQAGLNTSQISGDQIHTESEIGLSNLLKDPNINKVLSKDYVFNLQAIFSEKPGPNLRNEIAHGLLETSVACSPLAIYAWWFVLKLVVNSNIKIQDHLSAKKTEATN